MKATKSMANSDEGDEVDGKRIQLPQLPREGDCQRLDELPSLWWVEGTERQVSRLQKANGLVGSIRSSFGVISFEKLTRCLSGRKLSGLRLPKIVNCQSFEFRKVRSSAHGLDSSTNFGCGALNCFLKVKAGFGSFLIWTLLFKSGNSRRCLKVSENLQTTAKIRQRRKLKLRLISTFMVYLSFA